MKSPNLEINELEVIIRDVEQEEVDLQGGWSWGNGGLSGGIFGSATSLDPFGVAGFNDSISGSFSSPGGSGSMTVTGFGYVSGRGTATVSATGSVTVG